MQLPNFLKGLDGQLREGVPSNLTNPEYMGFMVGVPLMKLDDPLMCIMYPTGCGR